MAVAGADCGFCRGGVCTDMEKTAECPFRAVMSGIENAELRIRGFLCNMHKKPPRFFVIIFEKVYKNFEEFEVMKLL